MAYILSELNVSCKLLKYTIMDSKSASFHFKRMSNHLSLTKKMILGILPNVLYKENFHRTTYKTGAKCTSFKAMVS